MIIYAVWDSHAKQPPVLSAGYDEEHARRNNPLEKEVLADHMSRYHVGIIKPEAAEI